MKESKTDEINKLRSRIIRLECQLQTLTQGLDNQGITSNTTVFRSINLLQLKTDFDLLLEILGYERKYCPSKYILEKKTEQQ